MVLQVNGVPAFLIHAARYIANSFHSVAEAVEAFKGRAAFEIQDFSYESSVKKLAADGFTDSLEILLFLANSRTPRSRKQLREFVADDSRLGEVLAGTTSIRQGRGGGVSQAGGAAS